MKFNFKTIACCLLLQWAAGSPMMAQSQKGYDRENMNLKVKPGDNFVEYASGNWLKTHPLRDDQVDNGAFTDLYELNQKQIQELILQFANTPQEKGSLGYKIGTLYNQMMDSLTRDKQGIEPIKGELEKIRAIDDRKDFTRVTTEVEKSPLFMSLGVGADMRQADMNIVGIGQGGLGLGSRDYYFNSDEQTVAVREAYKKYCKKLFMLAGYDEAAAQKKVDGVYAIEERIAGPSYDPVKLRDIDGNYHKMTYAQLVKDFPGIDWATIFWESGYPKFNYIDIGQPEPIHEVEKVLAETSLDDLKSYAELSVLKGAASYLTQEFRAAQFEFIKVRSGVQMDDPMWKRATNLVNKVMGEAIGKMYCEKYFPESSKKRMLELVHNLQTALSQRIDEATWMGEATKAQAKDKLENFIVKIGYPDKWKDYSNMEVSEDLPLYTNLENISEFLNLDEINRKVNKPVDKMEWMMTPQTINAYYNPTTNEICFPAGILQPPFFDPEADDALNYGAIGGVIGHEMSHGFDDQGCQFDKTGNQHNWWTEQDKQNFDERAEGLASYFSSIKLSGNKKVNGKQTLGENIGDNGGLHIALRALHNTGNDAIIDGFTADQRFFLAWARVWAANMRDQYVDMLLMQDVHSPNEARVNGALPQIDEWYDAFNVKKGNKLFINKNKRVKIW